MNIMQVISIATIGWRSTVEPEERLELLAKVEAWVLEQRRFALQQQQQRRGGPSVHRAGER